MVRKFVSFKLVLLLLILALSGDAPARADDARPELIIYAYDSLLASGGLASKIIPVFEKRCGCRVRAVSGGDAAQVLSRVELESRERNPQAQVLWGIDQNTWSRAQKLALEWKPRSAAQKSDWNRVSEKYKLGAGFVPFDYGVFAWIADLKQLKKLKLARPEKLSDLLKPEWKRKLIIEDPRTSTPGAAFLLWVQDLVAKNDQPSMWKALRPQWLTLAPGWDQAYSIFLKGEAPLVWSYTTSQAYHREHGDPQSEQYQAVVLKEAQPLQVEGAVMLKETPLAHEFMGFLISAEVQSQIPHTQWMYPVRDGVELPESFRAVPVSKANSLKVRSSEELSQTLNQWSQWIRQ